MGNCTEQHPALTSARKMEKCHLQFREPARRDLEKSPRSPHVRHSAGIAFAPAEHAHSRDCPTPSCVIALREIADIYPIIHACLRSPPETFGRRFRQLESAFAVHALNLNDVSPGAGKHGPLCGYRLALGPEAPNPPRNLQHKTPLPPQISSCRFESLWIFS